VLEVARELAALAQRVRDGKAALDGSSRRHVHRHQYRRAGGTGAIPIINYPEVAILAVARARSSRWCATAPSSRASAAAHPHLRPPRRRRADGARFTADLVALLETPAGCCSASERVASW